MALSRKITKKNESGTVALPSKITKNIHGGTPQKYNLNYSSFVTTEIPIGIMFRMLTGR